MSHHAHHKRRIGRTSTCPRVGATSARGRAAADERAWRGGRSASPDPDLPHRGVVSLLLRACHTRARRIEEAVSVALSVQHSIGGACKLSGVDAHSVAKHDVDMMGSYFHRWVHTASTPSPQHRRRAPCATQRRLGRYAVRSFYGAPRTSRSPGMKSARRPSGSA